MGMIFGKERTRGYGLIRAELDAKRRLLTDRLADLAKAMKHVEELRETCKGLEKDVADLEHDESALTRGYIALMGDNAAEPQKGEHRE